MSFRLRRITFFVENLDDATAFYRDALELKVADIRAGWSAFAIGPNVEIAFHKGRHRKPRLEFVTDQDLRAARTSLNASGARLGPIKTLRDREICSGRDRDGNSIQLEQV